MLRAGLESFVGLFPIPMRHGMTIGELARLFNAHFEIGADLAGDARCDGWSRDMYWDATGLPWVLPSPNMPTLDTAIVYPGTVLFEGTNAVGGPRHDETVRTDRRAVDRTRSASRVP